MCGRLNCYCRYSSYSDRLTKKLSEPPKCVDSSSFHPSPNIAPTMRVPVLHVGESGELVLRPMKWGVSLPQVRSLVHNVRIETLSNSKFFRNLTTRHTCAVVCDGFYEWKGKRPFFFYDNSESNLVKSGIAEWTEDDWLEKGPPVTALAGVYSLDDSEYSCSVVTTQATLTSDIHHRIAIPLVTKGEILNWLSQDETPASKLSRLIGLKNESLAFYEVSDRVNNSKYQGNDCHLPKSERSGPLDSWVSRSKDPAHASSPQELSGESESNKRKNSDSWAPPKKSSTSSAKLHTQSTTTRPTSSSSKAQTTGPLDKWFSTTKKN